MSAETRAPAEMSERVFTELHRSLNADLWAFLRHRLNSKTDAEDLLQEVWLKIYRAWPKMERPESTRSWVFAIALNAVRSHMRGTRPQTRPVEESEMEKQAIDTREDPHQKLLDRQRLERLTIALGELSERDRDIVLLESMGGLDQAAIADLMELNLNTLKTVLRRARIRLAEKMAEVSHA